MICNEAHPLAGNLAQRVREFPAEARALVGQELRLVQAGEMPSDFKPMPSVGAGAYAQPDLELAKSRYAALLKEQPS